MTSESLLDPVRSVIKPEYRERIYNAVGATVVVLGSVGLVDGNVAATVAQIALATVTLGFAILYSTSEIRSALYLLLAAVQAAFAFWSIGNAADWAGVLSIAAAVLGTQIASGRTPAPYDLPRRFGVGTVRGAPWAGPVTHRRDPDDPDWEIRR